MDYTIFMKSRACLSTILALLLVVFAAVPSYASSETASAAPSALIGTISLVFILLLLFIAIVLFFWLRRNIFRPITKLNMAMLCITEGNFNHALEEDAKGEIGEIYQSYEDMRLRLKESAEDQIEVEKTNRELISNISHDLKTPITAIKGYVEGIIDGVADTPEKMDRYIRTIYNKTNDMDKLINELTFYTGIDTKRIPYNFHKIKLTDFFGDCVEEVGLELEAKNIHLDYSCFVSAETVIIADSEQLRRAVNNIIDNGVKYMDRSKEECKIEIRLLDEADSVKIEIEDNGRGIAAKDVGQIFERFFRTDSSRNSARGGSGIGLSVVKKIVEDHGGYIWASSRENEGTCIHVVFRKYSPTTEDSHFV
jgi:signal transduction histidine kinase